MENFYWQKGNEWDDNPEPKEEIDITGMTRLSEENVCCYCDEKNCNDYIGRDEGYYGQSFYCKYKTCKFDINNKFIVDKQYETSALYGGVLRIKVISRTENTITYIFTDDEKETYYNKEIVLQNGIESIEAWEYKEHKCHWYAKEQ